MRNTNKLPKIDRFLTKHNTLVFDSHPYDEELMPVMFFSTTCCAAGILSGRDNHTFEELNDSIHHIKQTSYGRKWKPSDRTGGEKCVLAVCCPFEDNFRTNLIKLKFSKIWAFDRREGYPVAGKLELWALNL